MSACGNVFSCVCVCASAKMYSLFENNTPVFYVNIVYYMKRKKRLLLCIDCCSGKRFKVINITVNMIFDFVPSHTMCG